MTSPPAHSAQDRFVVLPRTDPRWADDQETGFVHELAKRLIDDFEVHVLCPHAAGAARRELMDGVHVHRFRYAPEKLQTLVNDGGITTNLRRTPSKWLLVPGFVASLWLNAWRLTR